MKHFLCFLILTSTFMIGSVTLAIGDSSQYQTALMTNMSTQTGQWVKVAGYPLKTIQINGNYSASVYGNYSGTVLIQCAQTTAAGVAGPAVTCKDSGASTATSATTNTLFTVRDLSDWVRAVYTKSKHNVTVIMNYAQEKIAR